MDFDDNGLEVMGRDECLALLRTVPVGRIGLSVQALPVVLPVNFILDDDEEIIVRTAPGTKLTAAMAGSVVAFEADAFDAMSHSGWSVLVQGVARVLHAPGELARASALPLRPWANEATDWYLAIGADVVSGRRVRHWQHRAAHVAFVGTAGSGDGDVPGDGRAAGARVDLDAASSPLGSR